MSRRLSFAAAVPFALLFTAAAQAQVTPVVTPPDAPKKSAAPGDVPPDSDVVWRFAASVGGTKTSGNSRSASVNVTGEAVRTTDNSKLNLAARGLYAESNDQITGANVAFNGQYDRDLSRMWFGFGKVDLLRDRPANIAFRQSAYGGLGYHLVRNDTHTWDVSGGVGYTDDKYVRPANVGGELRQQYGRVEGVISESSTHKLTDTTSLRQKLGVFPNLRDGGQYRVVFDAGLSVAINASLSLTAGVTYRYDSDPGVGLRNTDAVYVTGIGIKFD